MNDKKLYLGGGEKRVVLSNEQCEAIITRRPTRVVSYGAARTAIMKLYAVPERAQQMDARAEVHAEPRRAVANAVMNIASQPEVPRAAVAKVEADSTDSAMVALAEDARERLRVLNNAQEAA